jgi:diguanylate cyclase (GGDEF)-like protein
MNTLMRWLAPRGAIGFLLRVVVLVVMVATSNVAFGLIYDDHPLHEPTYYLVHAAFVGGPFIIFFLAISMSQIKLQRKLWQLSRKDGLTNLSNRRTFLDQTDRRRQQGVPGVLLMLDADRFKSINDKYGHQAGDDCLKVIAYTLQRSLRDGDAVGRIGGEEFGVYLQNTTVQQARAIGRRLTMPIAFSTKKCAHLTVTMSIGAVASYPRATLDDMFMAADKALYLAKENGRAQMVVWDDIFHGQQPLTEH